MQIFKTILLTCALTVATGPVCLRAEDTAAQAAARAALQEKMRELKGGAPAAETPRAARAVAPEPVPAAPPAPAAPAVAAAPPAAPAPLVIPEGASPDLIEQARQATRARMGELQSHKRTAIPAGQEAPAPQSATQPVMEAAPATTVVTPAVTTEVTPAAPTAAELRAAKAREAAEKKAEQARAAKAKAQADAEKKTQADADKKAKAKAEADAKARAANKPAPAAQAAKPAKPAKKARPAAEKIEAAIPLAPLAGPASNLPATKEQSLQALLEQYKADKISAEEYHQQRAKILAEP